MTAGPTIQVFSCGAGVQSAAIALLMRDGRLPLVDHVIFANGSRPPDGACANPAPSGGLLPGPDRRGSTGLGLGRHARRERQPGGTCRAGAQWRVQLAGGSAA